MDSCSETSYWRKQADKYTILKMKENTPAPEGAYLCTKPKLIGSYKMLGERKLPP
jgi:hypothetical protein